MEKKITIALAGNPNSGKTTIFNRLTGARQKVGNWGGVTVEKKEGKVKHKGYEIDVVDLPGTYSLTAYSIEEIIARNYIIYDKPDIVVDVIDASNLERNLYLATQFIELDAKLIFAFNMMDMAHDNGLIIDINNLSKLLGVPIIPTIGTSGKGIDTLLNEIVAVFEDEERTSGQRDITYVKEVEEEIGRIEGVLIKDREFSDRYPSRWMASRLLEGDSEVKKIVENECRYENEAISLAKSGEKHIIAIFKDDPEVLMTDRRYGFISGAVRESVKRGTRKRIAISDNIDVILTNRLLGFPILFFFIWAMFQLTFKLGEYPMEWIDAGVGWLSEITLLALPPGVITDLLALGIIPGVGSVAVFIPNIFILFFIISLFEDTGYMARAAFIMDRVMHSIGLHGKSFIPMIMGFGCNVPAIMAARTLENRQDRILTILINPLISCSARLPVYILLAGTFFPGHTGNVIFSLYLLGIILAFILGRIFRRTFFKAEATPFVMELPPYRMPTMRGTVIHMWEQGSVFIRKMGSVILVGTVIIWFLSSFPMNEKDITPAPVSGKSTLTYSVRGNSDGGEPVLPDIPDKGGRDTYLKALGDYVSPVFEPLGFPPEASVALLSGFVAKEIVVSTFGVIYRTEKDESLGGAMMGAGWTPLTAYAFMVFVLLYIPCIATIATIKKETGSWSWTTFSVGYTLVLAWVMAFIIYNGGTLLGLM